MSVAVAAIVAASACKFPYPADVPDDDVTDDGGRIDGPVDSGIDARVRTHPLVQNHQAADLVIAQPNFTSNSSSFPVDGRNVLYPYSFGGASDRLWVADVGISRVLLFRPFPASNHPTASFVLGRPNFSDTGPISPSATQVVEPSGVEDTGTRLVVVDKGANRVLIWNMIPTTGMPPADVVLGQTSFNSSASGNGADQLKSPTAVWSDGQRVVITDSGNHRVLIWRTFPTSNGQAADVVLGQIAFGQGTPPALPSDRALKSPGELASDGRSLAVVDRGHNRVLVWQPFPDTNGAAAQVAVGQRDLASAVPGPEGDPHVLADLTQSAAGVAMFDGALFVDDQLNSRVLVFDPTPTSSIADMARASQVIGQPEPGVITTEPLSDRSLSVSVAVDVVNEHLFVGDWGNFRSLRYRLDYP